MALAWNATGSAGDSVGDANSVDVPVAGTPAAGDLLVIHVVNQRAENTWSTPSGWSSVATQKNGAGAFYKVAAGGETTTTVSKTGTTGRCLGRMMLIRGDTGATLGVDQSSSDTDLTVPGVTPTKGSTLWVWLASSADADSNFSTYAMATDDPGSWTERYEDDSASNQATIAGATSALRSQTTATGNLTASGGATGLAGIVFNVFQTVNTTVSVNAISATSTVNTPSVTTSSTVEVSAISASSTVNSPTTTSQEFPVFSNTSKNSASPSNTSKNAASFANTSKSSSSWDNEDKTQ